MFNLDALLESKGLYRTTLPEGQTFAWRLLTIKEYRVLKSIEAARIYPEIIFFSAIFDRCYAGDPTVINGNLPAGIFPSLGRLIWELSGENGIEGLVADLEAAREEHPVNGVLEHIKHVILIAFPTYTPESLEDIPRIELLRKFAIAEAVLQKKDPNYVVFDPGKIKTPEQLAKQANNINFKDDNAELHKLSTVHPLERDASEFSRQVSSERPKLLTRAHAKSLDKMR